MSNPIGWFEIYVDDLARAKRFYQEVLGISLEDFDSPGDDGAEMLGFPADMESYGSAGALVKMSSVSAGGNSTVVYFECEDCATEESRVEAAGGQVLQSKFSIGQFGFCAIVSDSEGNQIGLHSNV